ncbi:MAG: hypothetical protein FJZ38_24660 [Candidatus Rokubacteria bacterium]|nr:hypothetical protein [Candidatus Rokubacteria bacterium]
MWISSKMPFGVSTSCRTAGAAGGAYAAGAGGAAGGPGRRDGCRRRRGLVNLLLDRRQRRRGGGTADEIAHPHHQATPTMSLMTSATIFSSISRARRE